jgi:hypothetical protein
VPAHLNVEHVDLPVDGGDLALGIEDDAGGIGELLPALSPLDDRTADERDAMGAGPAAHRLDSLALLEGLGVRTHETGGAKAVPFLGEDDEVRPGRGRARHERLGALDVVRLRLDRIQLDAGDAQTIGHARRIALDT